ncbi:RagB/SusD family nutrient uptake outer membrane protein [Flavobacterium pectinovorum]|uniref:RagB/SusD family nutrient uptake outer membrane protein n=1 Tax=Flavobacterium pectinovorum TaxID=29533 RepID=UPI001FACF5E0|nr:RagB/SusD family nutrient uptake outer membrane protein [Flavobacterium pectinovorum]MCI9844566.1 RagB/SusD family nutrient uptake outer membrane protein [Flavobacterium pectinovorum]
MKAIYIITFYIVRLLALTFLFTSCDSFVDVALPDSQMTKETVFEDYATTNAALTDIYAKIRDRGVLTGNNTGLSNQLGHYADELSPYGTPSNTSYNFYNNALLPTNATIATYWNTSYNHIYAANSIIEAIEKNENISEENKNQLLGESLFIRALLHFYLVNLYGDMPYITTTDYRIKSKVTRIPVSEVYKKVISDLETAITLLPVKYSPSDRSIPNRYAAKALLARVYLYNQSYAEAANEASAILNENTLFVLTPKLNEVFLINSKETIWQLQSPTAGQNTKEGALFILTAGPPQLVALNTNLVNSFDPADGRKVNWIKTVSKGSLSWHYAYKYKERTFTSVSLEYSVVFRLAEQYLIRAEARAKQGDLIGAKEDLNAVRKRAGLQETTAVGKEDILTAILEEKRWEFFTEFGNRFFDLKRSNQLDAVLSPIKPGWNTTDALFPIPQNELNANSLLGIQNPGY